MKEIVTPKASDKNILNESQKFRRMLADKMKA